MRKLFKYLGRLLTALLALVLLALAYLNVAGFPDFLKDFVAEQFKLAGVGAHFTEIRFDLFRGVVAREAVLTDAQNPDRVLAQISKVELEVNWRRLLHKQNGIEALRIADADISVPTPADDIGSERFTAQHAYATLRFADDGSVAVKRLTGVYCGIRLTVSGRLRPPSAREPTPPPVTAAPQRPFVWVTRIVRELKSIKVTVPPQLDIEFEVDLNRPLDGRANVRLRGADIQYRGLRVNKAAVDVAMARGAVSLTQFLVDLHRGELRLEGTYNFARGEFDFTLVSTADPVQFVPLLPANARAPFAELKLDRSPTISLRSVLSPRTGSLPKFSGRLDAGPLEFRGVELLRVSAVFAMQGPEIQVLDAEVDMAEGRLIGHGQYHIESSDFAYELDSTLNPEKLLPLMVGAIHRFVLPAGFEESPHIVASVVGDFVDPDAFGYDARVDAGRSCYRGVDLQRASATLRLRQSRLDVQDLVLVRADGQLTGTVLADFNQERCRFDLHTTANPTEMAPLLSPKAAQIMAAYRFGPNLIGRASGLADFANPTNTVWAAQVSDDKFACWKFAMDHGEGSLAFTNDVLTVQVNASGLAWWKLKADHASANLTLRDGTLRVDNFQADFYGGRLLGHMDVATATTNQNYEMVLDAASCDVNPMVRDMRGGQPGRDITGQLTGHLQLTGRGDDLQTLQGKGNIEITDGVLWETALLGIFSQILGKTKATDAKASYTISDGFISTEDLKISAGAFTAKSHGKIGVEDGSLNFRVNAQFLSAWPGIGWIGKILGQILEYKVGGTMADPKYRPVNLPKELLPHD